MAMDLLPICQPAGNLFVGNIGRGSQYVRTNVLNRPAVIVNRSIASGGSDKYLSR